MNHWLVLFFLARNFWLGFFFVLIGLSFLRHRRHFQFFFFNQNFIFFLLWN